MSGGTWLSQNKIRAGAYINFVGVAQTAMRVGDRGIVTMPLSLSWGAEGELIDVLSSSLLDGTSKPLVGFDAFSSDSKLLAGALNYASEALVYRTNKGGVKATATAGELTITAKYAGTFGNKINITVTYDEDELVYTVITYVDGEVVDTQRVGGIVDLVENDYVIFSGTGDLSVTAGIPLTGGTNGTETESFSEYFKLLRMARWQVLAMPTDTDSNKSATISFIKSMREDEGRYVQAVIPNYPTADYEGIINSVCGAVIDGVTYSVVDFVTIVAGMTAGANINESNTARAITGATKIIGELTDAEIKKGLAKGQFILSTSASGIIKVEQDINSYHTFTVTKGYAFSKNRVIRVLDEIGTSTMITWEDNYIGKVDNNDTGRTSFRVDLLNYALELQRINAIQNVSTADITVSKGRDIDTVVVDWVVRPVDSMEKLYLTVTVDG